MSSHLLEPVACLGCLLLVSWRRRSLGGLPPVPSEASKGSHPARSLCPGACTLLSPLCSAARPPSWKPQAWSALHPACWVHPAGGGHHRERCPTGSWRFCLDLGWGFCARACAHPGLPTDRQGNCSLLPLPLLFSASFRPGLPTGETRACTPVNPSSLPSARATAPAGPEAGSGWHCLDQYILLQGKRRL